MTSDVPIKPFFWMLLCMLALPTATNVGRQYTRINYDEMMRSDESTTGERTMARVVGYPLELVNDFLSKLGGPIGIATYKPYQSSGVDFRHNYFGMIGVPIGLHPTFPTNANPALFTEPAAFDPDIVARVKAHLSAGKPLVISSGLLRAPAAGKGYRLLLMDRYSRGVLYVWVMPHNFNDLYRLSRAL